MLTLLLVLAASQYTVSDEVPPPPPPPVEDAPRVPRAARLTESNTCTTSSDCGTGLVCGAGVCNPARAARLLPGEPRVSAGTMLGRVAMSVVVGFVGELVGELAGLGLVFLGYASGSGVVFIGLTIFGYLVRLGIAALGVAIGSALFGDNFGADLRATMPVAAIAVGSAVLMGLLLSLAFPYLPALLLAGGPLLAAAICTPIIVQLRKPDPSERVMKDAVPTSGMAVAF